MKSAPTKKAQISMEVLYSVGTMIVIFLLLTGVTFNRKIDIRRTNDFLSKRDMCLKISNTVSAVSAAGDNTQRTIPVSYNVTVHNDSRIVVSETGALPTTVEVICTYTGNVEEKNLAEKSYTVVNVGGLVKFT